MSAFRRMFAAALVCLAGCASAQQLDQLEAACVLGPHWKQLSRSAGMVFTGTVLRVERQSATSHRPLPIVELKFQVDRAIAGVQAGQVLTLREWEGAASGHRAMRVGQRVLLFLYPRSRLGLTSPVGGALGQFEIDSQGKLVAYDSSVPRNSGSTGSLRPLAQPSSVPQDATLLQLERAIRSARKNKE